MPSTNSLLHSLKDQIRNVKYSIRAEAHAPGSMLPRALQSRELRRLTSLGSVVSVPAFRLADGIVTRVETLAMSLLGASARSDVVFPEPVGTYLSDRFDFTDKMFQALKGIVARKGALNVFVSEQAVDAVWRTMSKSAPAPGEEAPVAVDAVDTCAMLAHALIEADPIRQVGFRPGEIETNFTREPSLYCGVLVGLLIAVATCRREAALDHDGLVESVDSAVNARFDRFARAVASEEPIGAVAAEFRKLIPFLP